MIILVFYTHNIIGDVVLSDGKGGLKRCEDIRYIQSKVSVIENKIVEFKEHRVDNGFNNWFSQQYIESTKFIDGYKIRISMCKIKEIKSDSISVILFLEYRDKNGKTNFEKPNRTEYEFPKKILTEILVRS